MLPIALIAASAMAGQSFTCTATRVWDGDGPILCREGPRIRLAAIAARELSGDCRPGQPCPRASGVTARDTLVQLLGGDRGRSADGHVIVGPIRLRCRSQGGDAYGRTVAWCAAPGAGDLSCALVRSGTVLPWRRYGGDAVCRAGGDD